MRSVRILVASLASVALVAGSTAAAAAPVPAPAAQATALQTAAPSPWLILTSMSSAPAVALGGAAAAAQPADDRDAPPPAYGGLGINGEVVGLLFWFALIAIAIIAMDDEKGAPESPQ
jgi:hypothetical protein